MSYQLTNDARESLAGILHYIAQDNQAAAQRVNDSFFKTCEDLATMPGMGWHPDFATDPGILCFTMKKYQHYLIVYRKRKNGIVIIDVVHGARDLPGLFDDQ